jgi:class 3 adenylate cyclase
MLDPKKYKNLHDLSCVALVVDVNGSELMFNSWHANLVGQFVRDILVGSIRAIELAGGSILSFTGDGLIAALTDEDKAAEACWGIAHDFRKLNEYLMQKGNDGVSLWPFMHDDFGLKIALERGVLEVNTVHTDFLGEQPFIVGEASIYASRMLSFGKGNRCLIGPRAAARWNYGELEGPFKDKGKHEGIEYEYYLYDMSDIWVD